MAKKKKGNGKRILLTVLCVFFGLVLAVMAAGTIYINVFLNQINRFEETEETLSDHEVEQILAETGPPEADYSVEEITPEEVTMPTAPAQKIEAEDHIVNILLIGQDRRGSTGRARSDAMILCTVNTQKKTLVMTSFLRDMYVRFPEYNGRTYYNNRINVPYVIGGMEMLNDTLELNFGVQVDHNIEVDFSGFEQIVDMVGGVEIDVTLAEANWLGGKFHTGINQMNGEEALRYSRIRKLDSDFGRTNRQRKVITAILNKVRSMNLSQLTELAENMMALVTTDMSNAQIIKYVLEFFPILPDLQITTQHIPAEGTYYFARIAEMAVIVPDFEANIEILKDTIG